MESTPTRSLAPGDAHRLGTAIHCGLPGFDRLSEAVNFRILRNALTTSLDPNPEKRAFRAIA